MNSFFSDSHINKRAKFLKGIDRLSIINPFNSGLTLDGSRKRISHKRSMQSAAIFGPSGSSKTVSYIIPNLMRLKNVSIYVTDPSQELFNLCSEYLSKHFKISAINLADVSQSSFWNPYDSVKNAEDSNMMADAIISSTYHNESGSDIFWNKGAKSILNVCQISVLNQPENKTPFGIFNLLNEFNNSDQQKLNEHFSKTLPKDSWTEYKGLISQPEKVFGSQLATAKVALSPFSSPTLRKISEKTNIDFKQYRKTPSICFIIIPEHLIKDSNYSIYVSLLFREIFENLMVMPEKKDLHQYLLFDEAGNIFVPKLANYITVLRKRKSSTSLICQSVNQLHSLYNKDAETILENTLNHIYFPGLSLDTCQKLSAKIGNKPVNTNNYWLPTNQKEYGREPLISAESLRTLKNNRAVYIYGNLPAVVLKLRPWFKQFSLKRKLRKGKKS